MASYIRLYLVPRNGVQQVIDVDSNDLVLSGGGFVPPQMAPTVTLVGATFDSKFTPFTYTPVPEGGLQLTNSQQEEVRICWREPVGTDDYPNQDLITAADPSGGECVCGITCQGTNIAYVQVHAVSATV
jgi:hypothetical protein